MRKRILIALVFTAACFCQRSAAQTTTDTLLKKSVLILQRQLLLTADQAERLTEIKQQQEKELKILTTENRTPEARKPMIEKIHESYIKKLKKILTSDQWKLYDQMIRQRKAGNK